VPSARPHGPALPSQVNTIGILLTALALLAFAAGLRDALPTGTGPS
jgi:hypothetical protein